MITGDSYIGSNRQHRLSDQVSANTDDENCGTKSSIHSPPGESRANSGTDAAREGDRANQQPRMLAKAWRRAAVVCGMTEHPSGPPIFAVRTLGGYNWSSQHDLCWPIGRHRDRPPRCLTVTLDEFISIAGYHRKHVIWRRCFSTMLVAQPGQASAAANLVLPAPGDLVRTMAPDQTDPNAACAPSSQLLLQGVATSI